MEVLIVAKMHMKNAACVGAFEIGTKKNIRLLTAEAENQPENTDFEVGQIWDITYTQRPLVTPPHIEDVLVSSKKFIGRQHNIKSFLLSNAPIWKGGPDKIFDGKVKYPNGKSGYITQKGGIPKQSVGFWLPDKPLELTILEDQKHYFYFGDYNEICAFPLTGYISVVEQISKGILVRVSLARWWNPFGNEKRCYCQISGWYTDDQNQIGKKISTSYDDLPF